MKCSICKKRIWFWQSAYRDITKNPNMYRGKKRSGRHSSCERKEAGE